MGKDHRKSREWSYKTQALNDPDNVFKKLNCKGRILAEIWKLEEKNYTTLFIDWTTLQFRASTSLK